MAPPDRLRPFWTDEALVDVEELRQRAPAQARAVFRTVGWLAKVLSSSAVSDIGTAVPGHPGERYWPAPRPQGIFFVKDRASWTLYITAVEDGRGNRSRRWPR